jgi:two-component system, chemotaxis family, chemotaxis protein CheY
MGVFTDNRQKDSQFGFEVSPGHPGLQKLSPSVILLVDDDPDIRVLTRTFLEHEGYSVFSSSDADRASYVFRNVPQIDLLVTDLYMPGRSGLDLGRELKNIRSELPILLISGGMVDKELRTSLEEESWSFLAKPFRLPDLLTTVHRILAPIEARRWRVAT